MASEAAPGLKQVDGKTVVQVFMLDNSVKQLLVENWSTVQVRCTSSRGSAPATGTIQESAQDVVSEVCVKMGVQDVERFSHCFALCETIDGITLEHPLRADAAVLPIVQAWGGNTRARLVFVVKLFMDSVRATSDAAMVHLLYIQSVYNVITGIYPTSTDDAVSLASLQMQEKFGDHNPDVHVRGYLSHQLKGLVPAPLYPRKAPSTWENSILERHAQLNDEAKSAPALLYARILQTREYFGCSFFPVTQSCFQELPEQVAVGITSFGIYIFDEVSKATQKRFALKDIYRWGFHPEESFYFELKSANPGSGPYFEFPTIEGSFASDLLTDYAHQMLREMEMNKKQESSAAQEAAVAEAAAAEASKAEAAALLEADRQRAAAMRLQSLFRGFKVRDDLHKQFAATRVQAAARGFLARCLFERMIAELEAELMAEEE